MISTSGATAVYRSISPPRAEDRQGAKPPAVSRATLETMSSILGEVTGASRSVAGLAGTLPKRPALGSAHGSLLRRAPGQPAAADHRQGRGPATRRRPHCLPDRLLL